mmetsp:Transcript_59225/g.183934  ORF Transcript_59225/g.183934 Transcript_59225/m.183934 type:complete len:952 (+) Transcript_59225:41-2896(+)
MADPPGGQTTPDHDDEGEIKAPNARAMFLFHFGMTFTANTVVCVGAIVLWSTLGICDKTFDLLDKYYWASIPMMGAVALIVTVLYLLDFFWPQHIMNQVCVLFDGDRFVGRLIFCFAVVLFALACLLRTESFLSMPLIITIIVFPLAVCGAHMVYDPWKPEELRDESGRRIRKSAIIYSDDVHAKMLLLKKITGDEMNSHMLYKAIVATFFTSFAWTLVVWTVFTVIRGDSLSKLTEGKGSHERDRIYVQWTTPLVVSVSNLCFGLFAVLRVYMHQTYVRTDKYKNKLLADFMDSAMIKDLSEHRVDMLRRARHSSVETIEQGEELKKKREQYLKQDMMMAQNLSYIIKGVICVFVVLMGLGYAAQQLLSSMSHIATMISGITVVFFVMFAIFTYVSLGRIVDAMGKWMMELPAWRTLLAIASNNWVKALMLCAFAPALPAILVLSVLNQFVRKLRGIYQTHAAIIRQQGYKHTSRLYSLKAEPEQQPEEEGAEEDATKGKGGSDAPPESLLLTPRVHYRLQHLLESDWLSIISKTYILCLVFICLWIFPPLLNVVLAFMRKVITDAEMSFALILVVVFIIGVFCFLLPPVPGMLVYFFAGLVIADNCPPRGTDQGFWTGCVVNIGLCWFLKLFACAIQQAGIGGMLSTSLWVRQTVRIHKVGMRCMEKVMRRKGLDIGKVAILCGGPDWPISVLAGILKLSLLECEIGTLPIIGFIIPFALSGSFYLKMGDEGSMLANAAKLMAACAGILTAVLGAIAAWAVQQVLEQHHDEVTRPLAKNVDLEWLDYRADYVQQKLRVSFADVPIAIRALYACGAVVQVLICHLFVFGLSYLVGEFSVSDPIGDLVFIGGWSATDGLFTYYAIALLAVYALAGCSTLVLALWKRSALGPQLQAALEEVKAMEVPWKEEYIRKAENWDKIREEKDSNSPKGAASGDPAKEGSVKGVSVNI